MSNSFDQDAAQAVVEEIEREMDLIKSSQGKHMKYARERRDVIKDIYKSAKEDGLPEDVVKTLLKMRANNRDNHQLEKNLSSDYQPIFKPLKEALGLFADSPLGQAAADAEQQEMFSGNADLDEESDQSAAAAAANQAAEQLEGEKIIDRKKAH